MPEELAAQQLGSKKGSGAVMLGDTNEELFASDDFRM